MLQTAVNEQQVGLLHKFFVPVQIPAEPPGQHLLHGGVVVRALHILQLKAAVVPLQGPSVHIDHHGGHDVTGSSVGDVVGLHPPGGLLHAQHPGQRLQQLVLTFLPGGGPGHLFCRVLVGQPDQIHLCPPLWGHQLHPAAHLLGLAPLPLWYFGFLAVTILAYMLLVTAAKRWYIQKYHTLL